MVLSLVVFHRSRLTINRDACDPKSRIVRAGEVLGNDQRERNLEELNLPI